MKKTKLIENTDRLEEYEDEGLNEIEQSNFTQQIKTEKLRQLIQELPEQYRYVLNLYAIEGYSHKEIGKILKIKESTSRSNYTRARKKLMDSMNKEGFSSF